MPNARQVLVTLGNYTFLQLQLGGKSDCVELLLEV